MVNFTCNTCGDSLKKKEVSTHFSRKPNCRQAASLTCFDCLKEFGLNYDSHTVCITEDQRYSTGGLSTVSKNKQQEWTDSVHKHVKSVLKAQTSTLPKSVVNALEYLCKTASIPKKEKAFFNFLRNVRRYVESDIRAVWEIVQEVQKQIDAAKTDDTQKNGSTNSGTNGAAPKTNGKVPSSTKDMPEPMEEEVAHDDSKPEVDGEQKRKKKKSKKTESSGEVEETTTTVEVLNDLNESKKTKKKKEKSADTPLISKDIPMEVEEVVAEPVVEQAKLSKKEKKMKKKQEKFEAELKAVAAENKDEEEVEEPAAEEGKKKKKNKKHPLDAEENLETERKSKKKRERTVSMAAEGEHPKKKNKQKEYDENTEPNEVEEEPPSRKEFNWNHVIIQVLESQDDKEMSVKRLCKKVVNEYLSSLLEGAHVDEVKATAKFQKKLYKTPGVFVHKDKAKLKATDEKVEATD